MSNDLLTQKTTEGCLCYCLARAKFHYDPMFPGNGRRQVFVVRAEVVGLVEESLKVYKRKKAALEIAIQLTKE